MTATEATTTHSSSQACDALPLFSLSLWSSILTLTHPPDFFISLFGEDIFWPSSISAPTKLQKASAAEQRESERESETRSWRARVQHGVQGQHGALRAEARQRHPSVLG